MKKLLLFIIIGLTSLSSGCLAQKRLIEGTFKVDGRTLVVKRNEYALKGSESFNVFFEDGYENKLHNRTKKDNAIPVLKKDIHFDLDILTGIVYTNLTNQKDKIASNNGIVYLSITFQQDGSIVDILYSLQNIPLSLGEFMKIDKQIKKEIKATFTGKDYLDHYTLYYPDIKITF